MDENKWASRKLLVVAGSVLLAFGAMWAPQEARAQFYELMKWVIPTYLGGQSLVDAAAKYVAK